MRALARQRPLVVAHGALLFAALIYSGYNVLLARSLKHLSPVTFSLCRELVAIPLLYLWAARAVARRRRRASGTHARTRTRTHT